MEGTTKLASDKFVERMQVARANEEMKKKMLESSVGSGNKWKNKLTTPEAPKLAEKTAKSVRAL